MPAQVTCSCGIVCRTRDESDKHAEQYPNGHVMVIHEAGYDPFKDGTPVITIPVGLEDSK